MDPLNDVSVMDVDADPEVEEAVRDLKTVEVAMRWLGELRETVRAEGVSETDIHALNSIRETLTGVGVVFDSVPGLEQYSAHSFTSERSSVNLTPGLESMTQTIIKTIKAWLGKIVEFIKKATRWFLKLGYSDDAKQRNINDLLAAIKKMSDGSDDVARRWVKSDEDVHRKLADFWKKEFEDNPLPMDALTMALMGSYVQLPNLTKTAMAAFKGSQDLEKIAVQLHDFYLNENGSSELTADLGVFRAIKDTVAEANLMLHVSPAHKVESKHTFYQERRSSGGVPVPSHLREVSPVKPLSDAMYRTSDLLKDVQKNMKPGGDAYDTTNHGDEVKVITGLSNAIDDLIGLIRFTVQSNARRIQILNKVSRYENYRFTVYFNEAKANAVNDAQSQMVEQLRLKLETYLSALMRT